MTRLLGSFLHMATSAFKKRMRPTIKKPANFKRDPLCLGEPQPVQDDILLYVVEAGVDGYAVQRALTESLPQLVLQLKREIRFNKNCKKHLTGLG